MARVFKCDRCGEYEDNKAFRNKKEHTHTITYRSVDKDDDREEHQTKQIEVCAMCFAAIKNVIENQDKKNEPR
jgi:hypothetical protein